MTKESVRQAEPKTGVVEKEVKKQQASNIPGACRCMCGPECGCGCNHPHDCGCCEDCPCEG